MLTLAVLASVLAVATAQLGLCPGPNGDFPNPNSEQCTTFFRCIQGNAILLRCPANQRFDFLFRFCRQQRVVNCNNQLQVFAAPAAAPRLGGLAGGAGALLGGGGGLPGLGALGGLAGGLAGGQLGAGLPDGGLITLLSRLGSGDGDGQNGSSNLATMLMMTALMNRRNSATQQQNTAAAANIPNQAVLPIGYLGNPGLQQTLNAYTPEGAGIYPGPGITSADGRPYFLLPQDPNQQAQAYGQRNSYPWNGAQTDSILFGQSGAQGQNPGFGGIAQSLLQNIVALPAGQDTDSSDSSSQDSKNETRNANNRTSARRRRKNRN